MILDQILKHKRTIYKKIIILVYTQLKKKISLAGEISCDFMEQIKSNRSIITDMGIPIYIFLFCKIINNNINDLKLGNQHFSYVCSNMFTHKIKICMMMSQPVSDNMKLTL
jgi:hypothetical protein